MPGVTFLHDCSRHCCCGAAGASWVGLFRHDLSKPETGRKIKAAGSERKCNVVSGFLREQKRPDVSDRANGGTTVVDVSCLPNLSPRGDDMQESGSRLVPRYSSVFQTTYRCGTQKLNRDKT